MPLFINEIFATIQGEGSFTGTPSVFIRLQGCPVHCPWCDTKHTWKLGVPNDKGIEFALAKADSSGYATVETDELLEAVKTRFPQIPHVVITGGEPTLFDLEALTAGLIAMGKSVQIETSGIHPVRAHEKTWVTLSPKIGMPSGLVPDEAALARADEIKMPVGSAADIAALEALLPKTSGKALVYLQPISCDPAATKLCMDECMARGWRLSVQTHKYLHIR